MANFNFNKVILGGRLTADPELKQTQAGHSVATFSIAVNRRARAGEEAKVDFFNIVAWRQTADFVARYFRKGSAISIVGNIQNSSWTDQQGEKHYRTDIVADEVYFVDSRAEAPAEAPAETPIPEYESTTPQVTPNFQAISSDDDLPF